MKLPIICLMSLTTGSRLIDILIAAAVVLICLFTAYIIKQRFKK